MNPGVSELWGSKIALSHWLMAYTTACTTVQAVIDITIHKSSNNESNVDPQSITLSLHLDGIE